MRTVGNNMGMVNNLQQNGRRKSSMPSTSAKNQFNQLIDSFETKLQCFSIACIDMPDMEFGDKIVLPSSILRRMQTLQIPTPFHFEIKSSGNQRSKAMQYCGVLEFSAPENQAFVPYWMMQNLTIEEGAIVSIKSALQLPQGVYCRFRPHSLSFLDLAANLGPKILLEAAMRRYSVLCVDEVIMIEYGSTRYYLDVLEVKPGTVISLCGSVDLEVDFTAPNALDHKRSKAAILSNSSNDNKILPQTVEDNVEILTSATNQISKTEARNAHQIKDSLSFEQHSYDNSFGRRLGDGGFVECSNTKSSLLKEQNLRSNLSFSRKPNVDDSKSRLIMKTKRSFQSAGYSLLSSDNTSASIEKQHINTRCNKDFTNYSELATDLINCSLCLSEFPKCNLELHEISCIRNPAYHKHVCEKCGEKILNRDQDKHLHCTMCKFFGNPIELSDHISETHEEASCSCGKMVVKSYMENHKMQDCGDTMLKCKTCHLEYKRAQLQKHIIICSNRTQQCEFCDKYVRLKDFEEHYISGCATNTSNTSLNSSAISNQVDNDAKVDNMASITCVYCEKGPYTHSEHENHIRDQCLIARQFNGSLAKEQDRRNQKLRSNLHCGKYTKSKLDHRKRNQTTLTERQTKIPQVSRMNSKATITATKNDIRSIHDPLLLGINSKRMNTVVRQSIATKEIIRKSARKRK